MREILRFLIRVSAFVSKEFSEILRQTRLILVLVLGPFLIMLLFGLGYRNEARPLRTVFVVNEGDAIRKPIEEFANSLGPQLVYEGITSDPNAAMKQLETGQVDLVVVAPEDAENKIRNSEQAVFTMYHNEIDPYQVSYVEYFGKAYIDEVNRRVLMAAANRGKEDAASIQEELRAARMSAERTRTLLASGDTAGAQAESANLGNHVDAISLVVGGSLSLLTGVNETLGVDTRSEDQAILETLRALEQNRNQVNNSPDDAQRIDNVKEMEDNLAQLETQLAEFQSIRSDVLVAPFGVVSESRTRVRLTPTGFFVPGVIALLLQHLAITFAALSLVREKRSGTLELFRISPLDSGEVLLGKYLSYMILGGIIALIISLTVIFGVGAPMIGSWGAYALILAALLFTALGIGFLISLISTTDTQAVQFAMFMLLGSVFFSGFILDLRYLWGPVRVVSWAMPATYAMRLLQDVMLRGLPLEPLLFYGLLGIGLAMLLVSWALMHVQMRPN